jgi:hypothetical protein
MRIPSWYKVLEDAREASLEVAAACAESYATLYREGGCRSRRYDSDGADDEDKELRQKAGGQRARASSHCRDRDDFLYDVTRLHINYLNQVAMLGSSYAAVVARGLEALYSRGDACRSEYDDRSGGDCKPERRHELELYGTLGEHATGRVCVRNERRESAELDIEELDDGELSLKFREVGARSNVVNAMVTVLTDAGSNFTSCELGQGERVWLVIRVALARFEPGRRYRAELPIRVGGRSKPLCLIVRAMHV